MKHSNSLTSLSSMDKDVYSSSLTHIGRAAPLEHSATHNHSHSKMTEELQLQRRPSYQSKQISEAISSNPHKRRKRHNLITANLCGTRYEVVRRTVEKLGFTIVPDDDPASYLIWNDSFVSPDRISELKQYQHVNHFPGMVEVTRKDALARNFSKMQKAIPDVYNFIPKTWVLPADYLLLQNYAKDMKQKKKNVTFIVKPSNGAQGHGISLFRNAEKIQSSEHYIVQEYIDKPLLLDGYKFDLRIYVLITHCDPLRIFLYNDGLVRLATEKYMPPQESNIHRLFMHLTNYAVNKRNELYDKNMAFDTGSKRSIRYFNEYLQRSDIDVGLLWRRIADMIVQTLLVAQPHVLHAYRMCRPGVPFGSSSVCFEILGFDVMIDRKLRPWLLEVNRSPSLGTDEKLDYEIKSAMLEDTLRLLDIRVGDKRKNIQAQKAEAQKRLFRLNRKAGILDFTVLNKRSAQNEKRKEELKDLLYKVRKIASKEEFERRNCGRFRRIFPSDNHEKQDHYCKIMNEAFSVFLAGRGASMQKEIQVNYGNKYKEDEILDMIAECETYERDCGIYPGRKPLFGPKPLQSMPESLPAPSRQDTMDEDIDDIASSINSRHRSLSSGSGSRSNSRRRKPIGGSSSVPTSGEVKVVGKGQRPFSQPIHGGVGGQDRSRSLTRAAAASKVILLPRSNAVNTQNMMQKEKENEFTKKTLISLREMRIKFPGKTDEEAELLLDEINENWKFHKPRIASYWLVKLDTVKRRKVIDIVRHNVRNILQHIWHTADIDSLRLCRIFGRLFNRLLWSHGQGLWLCFSSKSNVWETMFCKSGENVSDSELECCRRITQLCQDCLLIVYMFAEEARSSANIAADEQSQQQGDNKYVMPVQTGYVSSHDLKPPINWTPSTKYSQRFLKLYPTCNHSTS
ncbi:unnamed protein product [Candidula unifasciata]|uniref:Tubulin polyglutamylase TTLL7 n=1 Tax=Candidula unifasciata TaxID=100452 RepID=A0A8S3YDL6_9EUPU|nr:unnamed protein product [Candidula unifasciata]